MKLLYSWVLGLYQKEAGLSNVNRHVRLYSDCQRQHTDVSSVM